MKVAYIRVSTVEQNEARQLEALRDKGIDKYFTEKVSAKDANRPELKAMLDYVREGDVVYVHDLSRLARNTKDLLAIVDLLEKKNVSLVSNKESLDTATPAGRFMLTMLAAVYQFERENMLERQREGIAVKKAAGGYKGGQSKKIDAELFDQLHADYMNRKITKSEMARQLGVSRPTLDKKLKEMES